MRTFDANEVLERLLSAFKVDELVEIETCHLSGISYYSIGGAGISFLRDVVEAGYKVKVLTTCNPMALSLADLHARSDDVAVKQREIVRLLIELGVSTWFTCTPYEHLKVKPRTYHAWCESSAVAYMNSIVNAFTEKLPGMLAVISAVCGRIPKFGLYRLENRIPRVRVRVNVSRALDISELSVLGKLIAEVTRSEIPYVENLRFLRHVDIDYVKALLSSYATYSSNTLMVIEGVSRDYTFYRDLGDRSGWLDKVEIDESDVVRELESHTSSRCVVYVMGCPYMSYSRLKMLIRQIIGRDVRLRSPALIFTSQFSCSRVGRDLIEALRRRNVYVYSCTCPVVSDMIKSLGADEVLTDSMKLAFYLRKVHNVRAHLIDTKTVFKFA